MRSSLGLLPKVAYFAIHQALAAISAISARDDRRTWPVSRAGNLCFLSVIHRQLYRVTARQMNEAIREQLGISIAEDLKQFWIYER